MSSEGAASAAVTGGVVAVTGRGNNMKGAADITGVNSTLSQSTRGILLVSLSTRVGLARVFLRRARDPAAVCSTLVNGDTTLPVVRTKEISLIPSSIRLSQVRVSLTDIINQRRLLARLLTPVTRRCSCVVVSAPPSLNVLALVTLGDTASLFIPLATRKLPLRNLRILRDLTSVTRRGNNTPLDNVFFAHCGGHGLGGTIVSVIGRQCRSLIFSALIQRGVAITRTRFAKRLLCSCTPQYGNTRSCQELAGRVVRQR